MLFAGAQGPSLSRLTWRHGSNHSDVKTLRFRCEKNRSIRMNCRDLCSLQPKSANQASVAKSKCIDPLARCCGHQRSRYARVGNRSETAIRWIKRKAVRPRRCFLLIVHRVTMRYLAGLRYNLRRRWRNSDHLVSASISRSGSLPPLLFLRFLPEDNPWTSANVLYAAVTQRSQIVIGHKEQRVAEFLHLFRHAVGGTDRFVVPDGSVMGEESSIALLRSNRAGFDDARKDKHRLRRFA